MKGKLNLWVVTLGLVVLVWVTACAGTSDMMGKEEMMATEDAMAKNDTMDKKTGMASGDKGGMGMQEETSAMLMGSGGHHAAGKVVFGMGMNNRHVLTLSDIKVDKVPDGYVYLTRDGDWMHGTQLGKLKQFSGTVSFDLPAGVTPETYDTVVIWCKKFNVEIGRAHFGKKMM
jgi:hypothetical protein